jgi:hypothetical protein
VTISFNSAAPSHEGALMRTPTDVLIKGDKMQSKINKNIFASIVKKLGVPSNLD